MSLLQWLIIVFISMTFFDNYTFYEMSKPEANDKKHFVQQHYSLTSDKTAHERRNC